VNATVRPYSNNSWIVEVERSAVRLGYIQQSQAVFSIIADPDSSPLAGISMGPWHSKENAMDAIADKLKGTCTLGP
jgi:hypothetical protein